ncbi:flagellar biosynthesis protein FlhB [Desulfotalea psychrophila]|uniref:Flagellar biosynthetic protein FlhB n=1 Tax=Desulfotalea psychrophila (strain LSv54 / DSM 12343) TaxID=177439 RepID=Q3V7H3_DESPS|nr:flagellar biosynthesis protein FlhB [Desulfotalea psychrophila]CAG37403.1 related to flagellar biosynthetic protein (FlhB) [Desulfotalea psychrophila LSv54]
MAEEAPTGGERTEDASSKRREDFRKKGQVAQSKEVQTAALFTLLLLFWSFYIGIFGRKLLILIQSIWQSLESFSPTPSQTMQLALFVIKECAIILAPLFLLVVIVGIASSFFQIGWLFTTKPLSPDFSKMNPIAGFGRFFSKKSFIEVIKSLSKVTLIGWLAFSTIIEHFNEALVQTDTSPMATLVFIGVTASLIVAKVCAILILLAFIDFLYVKWEMEEKMKMTKQEQKEEFKESEGDPHIKSQIRAIQQEMARKRMMADVPGADVIITNPTHISIALRYRAGQDQAPIIVAKGVDFVAMKIREIARENSIPIIENPPVARMLHKIEIGGSVPEEMFAVVAEILAHVYSLKGKG